MHITEKKIKFILAMNSIAKDESLIYSPPKIIHEKILIYEGELTWEYLSEENEDGITNSKLLKVFFQKNGTFFNVKSEDFRYFNDFDFIYERNFLKKIIVATAEESGEILKQDSHEYTENETMKHLCDFIFERKKYANNNLTK